MAEVEAKHEADGDPPLPPALAAAFAASPEAHDRWRRLPRGDRWFQIGPISQAKKPETKARRAEAIVHWLLHEIDDTSMPPELETVLAADDEARGLFEKLSKRDRVDWCQHVRSAKKPETRVRRAEQLPERLRAKVVEKERRKAEGTDDLGGRFGALVIEAVGAELRAAGYRPRQKGRHWRRVRGERADLIGFHTFTRVSHEFAELRLEGGIYLRTLRQAMGQAGPDPARTRTEDGMRVPDGLTDQDVHFAISAEVDDAMLIAQIRRVLLARMAAIDAVGDLTDGEALVAYCRRRGSKPALIAALNIAGRHDEARPLVLELAQEYAAAGRDPRTVHWVTHGAEGCGLPLAVLPEPHEVPDEPVAAPPIRTQVPKPTISVDEQARMLDELQDALLARERERDDLVATVASTSIGQIWIEVANLDPETEAIIRRIVPDDVLHLITDRPEPVLRVYKRHRLERADAVEAGTVEPDIRLSAGFRMFAAIGPVLDAVSEAT